MIRFIRSAVVLAGIIGLAQPCFADPSAALAQAYAAAAAEQPAAQQPKSAVPASAWRRMPPRRPIEARATILSTSASAGAEQPQVNF